MRLKNDSRGLVSLAIILRWTTLGGAMLLLLLSSDTVEITPSWIKEGPLWWRTWSIPIATQQAAVQVMESRPEVLEASFVQQTKETVLGIRVPYTMSKTEAGMLAGDFIRLVREYTDKKASHFTVRVYSYDEMSLSELEIITQKRVYMKWQGFKPIDVALNFCR